jgi:hypothetical protein
MMDDLLRKRAIDVMNRITSHASAIPFLTVTDEPSDPPMDLNSIRTRLQESRYPKLQHWLDDVEQCWQAAESKNVENPTEDRARIVILARENRRLFEKEKRMIDILSAHNWGNEVVRLRGRMADIMSDPPPKIKSVAEPMIAKLVKQNTPPCNEQDLRCFVEASKQLNEEEDVHELHRIMTELQPDLLRDVEDLAIDVTKLSSTTLEALKVYTKAAFERRGLSYPT